MQYAVQWGTVIESNDPIEAVESTSGAPVTPERSSVFDRLRNMKLGAALAFGSLFSAADTTDAAPPVAPKLGGVKVAAATPKKVDAGFVEQAKFIEMPTEIKAAPLNTPDIHFIPQKSREIIAPNGPKLNSRVIPPVSLDNADAPILDAALLPPKHWVLQKVTYAMRLDAEAQIPGNTKEKGVALRWSVPLPRSAFDTTSTWHMAEAVPPKVTTLPTTTLVVHIDPTLTNNDGKATDPRGLDATLGLLAAHGNRSGSVQKISYDSTMKITSYRVVPARFEESSEELQKKLEESDTFKDIADTAKKLSAEAIKGGKKMTAKDQQDWVAQMISEYGNAGAFAATGFLLQEQGHTYCGPFVLVKGVALSPDGKMRVNQADIVVTGLGLNAPVMFEGGEFPEASVKWLSPEGHFDASLPVLRGNDALQGPAKDAMIVRSSKFIEEPKAKTVRIDAITMKEAGLDPDKVRYVAATIARERTNKYEVQVAGGNAGNAANK